MSFVVPAPARPALPVEGEDGLFPVRRIYCVGRNYADHAREMGADPDREPPFFFSKPADAIVAGGGAVPYPPATSDLHHEVELVVAIGKGGHDVTAAVALDHVYGYGIGLDLTRRDLQDEAKKARRPWDMSKGFDHSAPCSRLRPARRIGHPAKGAIRLAVNNQPRQTSDLSHMIWSVAEIIRHLSRLVELAPGDLVFTGTPAGVAAVVRGDRLAGHIDDVGDLAVTIV